MSLTCDICPCNICPRDFRLTKACIALTKTLSLNEVMKFDNEDLIVLYEVRDETCQY